MSMRSSIDTQAMIDLYTKDHKTMQEIANMAGVSKTAVYKRLKKANIKAYEGEWINKNCKNCGKQFRITRSRQKQQTGHYCSTDCYYDFVTVKGSFIDRYGGYKARIKVREVFDLQSKHVVHHIDGDQRHNELCNLMVFASQSDHLIYHRTGNIEPLAKW